MDQKYMNIGGNLSKTQFSIEELAVNPSPDLKIRELSMKV